MTTKTKRAALALLLITGMTSIQQLHSQSILKDYYNGDSVKMLNDARGLLNNPDPVFSASPSNPVTDGDAEQQQFLQTHKIPKVSFEMRDGKKLNAYRFAAMSDNIILFIHGVKSDASKYLKTAWLLQKATGSTVYALDLRGHGLSGGHPGDVDHMNQYTDDIADIIGKLKKEKPMAKLVLAGHSMGGGIVLIYIAGKYQQQADGYILMAPLLGHNSPAVRQGNPAATGATEPLMQLNFQRIIGLKMLNELGDHQHDSLPVMFFNIPAGSVPGRYTYRANMSMAPDNFTEGLVLANKPLLVIVGSEDEVFDAAMQKKAVLDNSKGEVVVVNGALHDNVCLKNESFDAIKKWSSKIK